ncbi:UNVERIFIED_CONTAM: hypothetical protein RMT77_000979 [Armadillidium vulgare]|nr:Transmembrane protein 18 [Armadillidium vulgare]
MEEFSRTHSYFVRTDEITDLWSFLRTIDWTEWWLLGLIVFHILLTTFTIMTRNYHAIQGFLFFGLLMSVRCSELINEYAAKNWQKFSHQQYFDSGGLFISVVFSMPILFNCLMMVINWLWQSSNMMAKVKRAELELRSLKEAEMEKKNE